MDFFVAAAVETPGHEMRAAVFLQQPAGRHRDAGARRHQVVSVFNSTVAFRLAEFVVLADTVEFQQPMLEAWLDVKLSGPDLLRVRVPGDCSLSPGAPGGSANRQDLL